MSQLAWVLSATTIVVMWLAGNKNVAAWHLSLVNQMLWSVWIVGTHAWGLLPMNVAMYIVAARNIVRWSRPARFEGGVYIRTESEGDR